MGENGKMKGHEDCSHATWDKVGPESSKNSETKILCGSISQWPKDRMEYKAV